MDYKAEVIKILLVTCRAYYYTLHNTYSGSKFSFTFEIVLQETDFVLKTKRVSLLME